MVICHSLAADLTLREAGRGFLIHMRAGGYTESYLGPLEMTLALLWPITPWTWVWDGVLSGETVIPNLIKTPLSKATQRRRARDCKRSKG